MLLIEHLSCAVLYINKGKRLTNPFLLESTKYTIGKNLWTRSATFIKQGQSCFLCALTCFLCGGMGGLGRLDSKRLSEL